METESFPVEYNGNVVGYVWYEGEEDWCAESVITGCSWGLFETRAEAEEILLDVADECKMED